MKELLDIKGIITVLNTPFDEEYRIHLESLRKNVSLAIEAGVAGFLVPAMASEVEKLSEKEREEMVNTVLDEVNGKVPVIGGASAHSSEERKRIARSLIDSSCDGVLVSIPYEDDKQYEKDVLEIARLDPNFLMLQDWSFTGYGIPIRLIKRLFKEIDCFKALKIEVVPAGVKYSEVLEATNERLHVSGGWAVMQLIEGLDRGVHAFMPTGMHKIYTSIYDDYMTGNRTDARRLFTKLLPVLAFSNQHLDISIHFFKWLLFKQGIYTTPLVRDPVLPFDYFHQKIASELIAWVIEIEESLWK